MVNLLGRIDYLEYLHLYKNRNDRRQVTWLELEEHFNRLVTKYTANWPDLSMNVVKYSALFRLIESYWGAHEHFPLIEEFSFQTVAWPSDTGSTDMKLKSRDSADREPEADIEKPRSIDRWSEVTMGAENKTARELCKAAGTLSDVSRELSQAFN